MATTKRGLASRPSASFAEAARERDVAVTTITADRRSLLPLREVWEYRELLYFLAWRDVKVRYKQTVIGAAWAVIQPLVTMAVFAVIFGRLAKIESGGVAYPLFAYAGLLPWQLFAGALQRAIQSVVQSAPLISKVYFPRVIIPLAATLSAIVDFVIAFVVLVAMALGLGIPMSWRVVTLPGFVALTVVTALAVGLWLAGLNVRYRDVGHAVPFLIQVWMFVSPVVYPVAFVPERWQAVYSLNPMVGVIEGFRWAMFGTAAPQVAVFAVSGGMILLLLAWGLVYFSRVERTFADII